MGTRLSQPADLSWLSQFEHEREYVYAPGAHIELISSLPKSFKTHTAYQIVVTRNAQAETLENAAKSGYRAVESIAAMSYARIKNTLLASFGAAWGAEPDQGALEDVRRRPYPWYQE